MAGTRVLFASIGASVALVTAAALTLLAVSAIFAFGGWSASVSESIERPDLIFAGSANGDTDRAVQIAQARPLVIAPPVRTRARTQSRPAGEPEAVRAAERPATSTRPPASTATPALNPPAVPTVAPRRPALPPTQPRDVGNGVRKVGDDLTATLQGTGAALAEATQPLAPPVSVAVQEVLNLVAALVRRTTGGLAGTLDTLLPPK